MVKVTVKVGEIACFTVVTIGVNDVIVRLQVARHLMLDHCSDILFACLLYRYLDHVDGEERPAPYPH